jgi:hypothetical protein
MSDRWLQIQHNDVINRNRQTRQDCMAEAQRLADERRTTAAARDQQDPRS